MAKQQAKNTEFRVRHCPSCGGRYIGKDYLIDVEPQVDGPVVTVSIKKTQFYECEVCGLRFVLGVLYDGEDICIKGEE